MRDMTAMGAITPDKRLKKWDDIDNCVESFRVLHEQLEREIENPAALKQILVKIQEVQRGLDDLA